MNVRRAKRLAVLRRRRPALAVLACVLFALVLVMEALLVRSFSEVKTTTKAFTDARYSITDLANVQREALALARDVEQMGVDHYDDVRLRSDLLANQWRIYRIDVERSGRLSAGFADIGKAVDLAVADVSEIDVSASRHGIDAVRGDLRAELRSLDLLLKREYDRQEISYLGTFKEALGSRNASELQLLLLSGGVVVVALLVLALARRGVQQDFRDAYERLGESEERYRTVVDQVNEAIIQLDTDGKLTLCNRAWSLMTGVSTERSLGRLLTDFVETSDRDALAHALALAVEGGAAPPERELRLSDGRGGVRWVELDLLPQLDGHFSGTLVDVTDRVMAHAELERLAMRDPLTGLSNRAELTNHMELALARSERSGDLMAVLFLDLDRFKLVNDGLGHDVGDLLLAEVAVRLRACLRATDVAARLGGDEFVVVCESLPSDRVVATEEALVVARRILDAVRRPIAIEGREIFVTASIGLTIAVPGQRPDELLSNSDAAMYRAKDRGKARVELFDDDLRVEVERRATIEHDLHRCVARHEPEMWLQPVYSLVDGRLIRLEALMRWRHPVYGLLLPDAFLSIAEEMGHIERLGSWILWEACTAASRWPVAADGFAPGIAVNVSGHQLQHGRFLAEVDSVLSATGLAAERLCLEITETVYVGADPTTLRDLELLHLSGVKLAMDDFGTGYSSLSSLRAMPIDIVKLDRAFVAGLGSSAQDDAIIQSVIELGASLGFDTTAEGVEEPHQARRLLELGCMQGQGYLLGRPVPPASAEEVIAAGGVDLAAIMVRPGVGASPE